MLCSWKFLGMDSARHETLGVVMQILRKYDPYLGQANMLFVDGAFENRLTDLSLYAPLVKTLGTIAVHDTNRTTVYDQVQTYLKQCSFKTRVATMTQGHGLMVISKRMPYEPCGIRPEFHEMADEFCEAIIEMTAYLVRIEQGEAIARSSFDAVCIKITEIDGCIRSACHSNIHQIFVREGARIGEAARTLFLAQRKVTPQEERSYSVYFVNFMYYSQETFDTEEAAIAYVVDRGYDARIEKDDTPVASWSILGGLRRYPITPAQL